MNSFRTETYNITGTGQINSWLLQGGLRWLSITLLTGSSVTIDTVGITASVDIEDPANLPGSFATSDSTYGEVWDLGARAVQAACFDANTQPSTWELTDQDGVYIRGQYPAWSAKGADWDSYTLEFHTKITAGGVGWRVAAGMNSGYGPYFILTSNSPVLESLAWGPLAQNCLFVGYGYSIVGQQLLPSGPVKTVQNVPVTVENNVWYKITTQITASSYIVSVNDTKIAEVPTSQWQGQVGTGSGSLTKGTIGFGPWYQHAAYYKDVTVTDESGNVIYTNPMTSEDTLYEYSVHSNKYAMCLDGPKRDRGVWTGDFAHTGRSIGVATGRYDYIKSMIELEFDWQLPSGPQKNQVPIVSNVGGSPENAGALATAMVGLADYQFFFMVTLGEYFAVTNDTDTMSKYWDQTKTFVQTLISNYVDSNNLTISAGQDFFLAPGQQHATGPTALFVLGLRLLINVATVLKDTSTAQSWFELAHYMTDAINLHIWNGRYYGLSLTKMGTSSIAGTAFTIKGGIATDESSSGSINALADSLLNIGYKDTSDVDSNSNPQLSPNTQGFLLESLFLAYINLKIPVATVLPAIKTLTEKLWPAMAAQGQYYTGASWEYLYQDGSPGIGLFTSLGHPWGGAATYVYSNYILGIRTEWRSDLNVYEWVFDPVYAIADGLGLTWANGTVPLPSGGYILAHWEKDSNAVSGYTSTVAVHDNGNTLVNKKG